MADFDAERAPPNIALMTERAAGLSIDVFLDVVPRVESFSIIMDALYQAPGPPEGCADRPPGK